MKNALKRLFNINRQREKKEKLPIIRYMLYVLVVTITVTGVSLSRYSTTSSTGDNARIAHFDISVTHAPWSKGEYKDISAHALNGSKTYVFTVTNNGEVPVRVRLDIDTYDGQLPTVNPPGWFNLAISGSQNVGVTVIGELDGNDIDLHVEYEQID